MIARRTTLLRQSLHEAIHFQSNDSDPFAELAMAGDNAAGRACFDSDQRAFTVAFQYHVCGQSRRQKCQK